MGVKLTKKQGKTYSTQSKITLAHGLRVLRPFNVAHIVPMLFREGGACSQTIGRDRGREMKYPEILGVFLHARSTNEGRRESSKPKGEINSLAGQARIHQQQEHESDQQCKPDRK